MVKRSSTADETAHWQARRDERLSALMQQFFAVTGAEIEAKRAPDGLVDKLLGKRTPWKGAGAVVVCLACVAQRCEMTAEAQPAVDHARG